MSETKGTGRIGALTLEGQVLIVALSLEIPVSAQAQTKTGLRQGVWVGKHQVYDFAVNFRSQEGTWKGPRWTAITAEDVVNRDHAALQKRLLGSMGRIKGTFKLHDGT